MTNLKRLFCFLVEESTNVDSFWVKIFAKLVYKSFNKRQKINVNPCAKLLPKKHLKIAWIQLYIDFLLCVSVLMFTDLEFEVNLFTFFCMWPEIWSHPNFQTK